MHPEICNIKNCCGCGACAAICPTLCIEMRPNQFGFMTPDINFEKCLKCGGCEKVCPTLSQRDEDDLISTFWAKTHNTQELLRASSGGMFEVFAKEIISRKGLVVGAAFSDNFLDVRHSVATSEDELVPLLRSKYVQSRIDKSIYSMIKDSLKIDKYVLFVGTACQVAGLKNYLGGLGESAYFISCNVICHGVPTDKLWKHWIEHKMDSTQAALTSVNFRSKHTGWLDYSIEYEFDDCTTTSLDSCVFRDDWYMKAFLHNASLCESCFSCPARRSCGSDITLGDFWGVNSAHPEVEYAQGVSAVLCNTNKGAVLFDAVKNGVNYGEVSYADIRAGNLCLDQSVQKPKYYDPFMADIEQGLSIEKMIQKWPFKPTLKSRAKQKLKSLLKNANVKG